MAGVSRRDNFKQSVIDILFKRSGGKCCKCGATTFGPHTGRQDKFQNIGQAAHISAAAPGGPRYNTRMTPEERTSAKNGMWLCSNCHSQIDRDTERFTLAALRGIKREAEDRARKEVGVASIVPSVEVDEMSDVLQTAVSATTIVEIRKVKSSLLLLHGQSIPRDEAERILDGLNFVNLKVDTYHPQVGAELIGFFSALVPRCSDAEINLEAIRQFQSAMERFDSRWSQTEVQLVSNTLHSMTGAFSRRSGVYRSAVALLKNMSRNKSLASKKLHSIPLELLKELQQGRYKNRRAGNDDVDFEKYSRQGTVRSDSLQKDMLMDEEEGGKVEGGMEFVDYINRMVELAEASEEKVQPLEGALEDLGYEHDII